MSTEHQNKNRPNNNRGGRGRNHHYKGKSNTSNKPQRTNSQHQQFVKNNAPKPSFWQKILGFFGIGNKPEEKTAQKPQRQNTQNTQAPKSNTVDKRQNKEARPPREKRAPIAARDIDSNRLYVGNLSYDATEHDIEELFKGVGPVRSVEIVYNKHTHKSKGYGFVEMLRIDEAKNAVEVLHDQHFMGRKMVVSGAKAKNFEEEQDAEGNNTQESAPAPAPQKEEIVEEVHSLA